MKICNDCTNFHNGRGPACAECSTKRERTRNTSRPHHTSSDYRRRSKQLREHAAANPHVVCWLCGNREPPEQYKGGWQADHVNPGDPNSPLRPAHAGCNAARGDTTPQSFRQRLTSVRWVGVDVAK